VPVGAARRAADVTVEAPRTGARSTVQPTAKRKNAEQTANAWRPRLTTVNVDTLTPPSLLQHDRHGTVVLELDRHSRAEDTGLDRHAELP
jgi:hypothetical protein